MKRLILMVLTIVGILAIPGYLSAQSGGQKCVYTDPATGYKFDCFIPDRPTYQGVTQTSVTLTQSTTVIVQPVIINAPVIVTDNNRPDHHRNRSGQRQHRHHGQQQEPYDYNEPALASDQVSEPYYETQERRTVRQRYGGGIDRWSGRLYGHYEVQTEKVRVRTEANSLTYIPKVSISTTYWPSYYSW